MSQWSKSVVVVPSGFLLRCLRRDMVTDLVFEVWVMVLQGLLHHHHHEVEGGGGARGQKMKLGESGHTHSW